jgi:hypothetical protein
MLMNNKNFTYMTSQKKKKKKEHIGQAEEAKEKEGDRKRNNQNQPNKTGRMAAWNVSVTRIIIHNLRERKAEMSNEEMWCFRTKKISIGVNFSKRK